MERLCPICQKIMTEEHKIAYIDYHCSPPAHSHHYQARYVKDDIFMLKTRLNEPDGTKLFLKVNFGESFSEVWMIPANGTYLESSKRVRIEQAFMPDFSQIKRLRNKIQTYLVFS